MHVPGDGAVTALTVHTRDCRFSPSPVVNEMLLFLYFFAGHSLGWNISWAAAQSVRVFRPLQRPYTCAHTVHVTGAVARSRAHNNSRNNTFLNYCFNCAATVAGSGPNHPVRRAHRTDEYDNCTTPFRFQPSARSLRYHCIARVYVLRTNTIGRRHSDGLKWLI